MLSMSTLPLQGPGALQKVELSFSNETGYGWAGLGPLPQLKWGGHFL